MGAVTSRRRRATGTAVVMAALTALTVAGCAPQPAEKFITTDANDVVIKIPRSWTLVQSGPPVGTDGTAATDGSWLGLFDASAKPSLAHAKSVSATEPVAVVQSVVTTKERADQITLDDLRDAYLPVSAAARATSDLTSTLPVSNFTLIHDKEISTKTAKGVHVSFSYLVEGKGVEYFDQVAVVNTAKTRVHLFLVHCTEACWATHRKAINDAVSSFTVKVP